MSNDVFSSVGTVIAVSASLPTTENLTGFEALTYTNVAFVADFPDFGVQQAISTFVPLSTGITIKRGGSIDNGELTVPLALTGSDAGEGILRTKAEGTPTSDKRVSVRVAFANGDFAYFVAFVNAFRYTPGNADAIAQASVGLAVTSTVVYDAN
jgi:hypothetical protein